MSNLIWPKIELNLVRFESYLVVNPEDRFSRDLAHYYKIKSKILPGLTSKVALNRASSLSVKFKTWSVFTKSKICVSNNLSSSSVTEKNDVRNWEVHDKIGRIF